MQPSHHPSYETLLDYATGNLPLAPSIIVAVHCSICKECRDTLNTIDIAGAALMEELNAEELEFNSLDHVLSKLDNNFDNSNDKEQVNYFNNNYFDFKIPKSLEFYMPNSLNWKNLSSGVKTAEIVSDDGFNLDIYKIISGYKIPKHTHTGFEYTMVLDGGFTDNQKYFGPGDFSLLDNSTNHSPLADSDKDCFCIVSMNSQIKLTGTLGRLFNLINK